MMAILKSKRGVLDFWNLAGNFSKSGSRPIHNNESLLSQAARSLFRKLIRLHDILLSDGEQMIKQVQLYDDRLDFEVNKIEGPFGDYSSITTPYKNEGEPQYDFFGTPVYSPFGIGAGPLPAPKFIKAALARGFDIVTLKNVRTDTFPLNPYPQIRPVKIDGKLEISSNVEVQVAERYEEPLAVANSFGIPTPAPAEWQSCLRECYSLPQKGQTLLVSFQGTAKGKGRDEFVQDHVRGIELIRDTGNP